MTFQLTVRHPLRFVESTDGEAVAERLLLAIGYIPAGTGQRLEGGVRSSAGFKLFYHCLAAHPTRSWTVNELVPAVGATPATIYRHLLRLRELGLVAEEAQQRYRLWHHSLEQAWGGVEYHARVCQRNYAKLIKDIETQMGVGLEGGTGNGTTGTGSSPAGADPSRVDELPLASTPQAFNFTLSEMLPDLEAEVTGPTPSPKELWLAQLLRGCGFLEVRGGELYQRIPYQLFASWLLDRRDRLWTAEELATALSTSRPTIYRHLNRLETMGWVEKLVLKDGHPRITGFRLRGGGLTSAWQGIESELDLGLQGYRKAIKELSGLAARV